MELAPSHIYAELLAEVENEAKCSRSENSPASVDSGTDDSDDDFADELESQLTNAKRHKTLHESPKETEPRENGKSINEDTKTQIKNTSCLNAILEAEKLENAASMSRSRPSTKSQINTSIGALSQKRGITGYRDDSSSSSCSNSKWRCSACTYDNEATRLQCEICENQNPALPKINHFEKLPMAMIKIIFSFSQVGTRLGKVCKKFQTVNTICCRDRIKEIFKNAVGFELAQLLEGLLYGYCAAKVDEKYLQKSRSILLNLRSNSKQKSSVVERLKNGALSATQFVRGIVGNKPFLFASEEHIEEHKKWSKQQMEKATIKEQAPNGQGLFKCEHCKSQKIHYRLWKRKQQERYRNMLLCLDCRHQFEF